MKKNKYNMVCGGVSSTMHTPKKKGGGMGWKKKIYQINSVLFTVVFFLFFFLLCPSLHFQIFFKENTLFLQ